MMTPSWLADILAALMIATAVYCAARLVVAHLRRQRGERDVDATHVLMGVGMAGMLVSALDPVPAMVWEVVFGATTAWFAWRAARAWRHRATLGHGVVHMLANGAMLYMLMAGPAHGVVTGMGGMNGGASTAGSSGGTAYPTIGLVLAVFLAGYAVLVADRITPPGVAGPTGHNNSGPVVAAGRPDVDAASAPTAGSLAPRTAACCTVAMAATMAYMLITTL